jgi:hypothetical protein
LVGPRPCKDPKAAGFVDRDDVSWSGPWVFQTVAGKQSPLPWVGERPADRSVRPKSEMARIQFDDGRTGGLRVEAGECKPSEACAPADWSSYSPPEDSQWLIATDTTGRVVFREHFWAPYGLVEVLPVDLIDGPGDEVLVIRTWAHSSPSVGFALVVWKVGAGRAIDLSAKVLVGAWIGGRSNWRADLTVDLTQQKPRTIELRRTFGLFQCEPVTSEDRAEMNRLGREERLVFDPRTRKYSVR